MPTRKQTQRKPVRFTDERGEAVASLTLGDFIQMTADLPRSTEIYLSSDEEGNQIGTFIGEMSLGRCEDHKFVDSKESDPLPLVAAIILYPNRVVDIMKELSQEEIDAIVADSARYRGEGESDD